MSDIDNWRAELNNSLLYQALAKSEKDPNLAQVYERMATVEAHHAQVLAERIRAQGQAVPDFRASWRTRTLAALAGRFGPAFVLPSIVSLEDQATQTYGANAEDRKMAGQEQTHARILRQLVGTKGGVSGSTLAQIEGRHRMMGGNALRAAVLGANDGLVSNLSLVMGVAGAALASRSILVTGLAGLLAGAFSMALGEWLSVQSSRELYQHQIAQERAEVIADPHEEMEELALIYQARGLEEAQARQLAAQLLADEENAVAALAREELGVDPEGLGGSAWEAAITSFLLFAAGAIIPVIPYFFLTGMAAVGLSVALSTVGLFVIGAAITLFTGRSVLASGMRQVLFGLGAAAITYAIGRLVGVSLAG